MKNSRQIHTTSLSKFSNKRTLKQIAINQSSVVGFKHFTMFYKKCTKKLYSFLLSNTSLLSDKFSILKENKKVIITIDETLTDEKLQYNINTEVITIAL